MKESLYVIKVGGAIVEQPDRMNGFIDSFLSVPGHKILVHGGGRSATRLASRLGLESHMVDGRRITDSEMLEIVTMVYGGLVNKNIVAGLQKRGTDAIGLTGADGDAIRAVKRMPLNGVDYGFVGDVESVNTDFLAEILERNMVPVLAPLTHDGFGSMLNTNADTIAAATAEAFADVWDVSLVYCFEKPGVLTDPDDDSSAIPLLSYGDYKRLVGSGIISGGMIPKLENAFMSLEAGVSRVIITSAENLAELRGTVVRL